MGKKTVNFNKTGTSKLPNDKPILYRIETEGGKPNYVGVAKRSRVQERLEEHLPGGTDYIPGSRVQIERMNSIDQAMGEGSAGHRPLKPQYNDQGK